MKALMLRFISSGSSELVKVGIVLRPGDFSRRFLWTSCLRVGSRLNVK